MIRTSRSRRRLQLSPETIRILSSRALRQVDGGRSARPQTTVIEPTISEPPVTEPTYDTCQVTQPATLTDELCELP